MRLEIIIANKQRNDFIQLNWNFLNTEPFLRTPNFQNMLLLMSKTIGAELLELKGSNTATELQIGMCTVQKDLCTRFRAVARTPADI